MAGYKRYRKDSPVSYALGITLTFELLRFQPDKVTRVYIHSGMKEGETLDKLRSLCRDAGIEMVQTDKIFHVLSQKENCYVIGEFTKYEGQLEKTASHIVLVNPSNAGNMGTIMRSALGFGLNQMAIIRPAVDAFDPKVVRASMGRFFRQTLFTLRILMNIRHSLVNGNYIHLCWTPRKVCMRSDHRGRFLCFLATKRPDCRIALRRSGQV